MDRATIEQLDSIEEKLDFVIQAQKLDMNLETIDILGSFYEEEVLDAKGKLNHLSKDPAVTKFFEEMAEQSEKDEQEMDDEPVLESDKTESEDEYNNTPFKK